MAVALGSTGTFLTYTARTNSALTVPSGVAANDVILAYLYEDTTSAAVTPPTGFTELTFSPAFALASPFMACHVYWKRATAADTGTYTFTHASSSTQGIALRFTGCTTTGTPLEVLGSSNNSASTSAPPPITGTTSQAGEMLAYAAITYSSASWTTVSGWTDAQNGSGQYNAVKTQAAAGSTGAITATASSPQATIAALIGLFPASASTPKLHVGSGTVTALYVGNAAAQKAYIGATQVFP